MATKREASSCFTDVHVAPDDVRVKTRIFDTFACVTIGFGKVEFDLMFNDYIDDDEDLVTGLQQANDFAAAINAALLKAASDPNGGRS